MKIEKLRLKGFTGIKKGLGLDEITIDFTSADGLTAFEGMNGAGKSTVLENLHAYPALASREGALYQHVFVRDAEKELSFQYGGDHYRTLIKIDCQSGKSEGFIWKNGTSEVNGKITAYNKYVRELLGSPALFFSSVFAAQNGTKLSDMTTGELKGLFSEFLRLDKLAEYEQTAKNAANILSGQLAQLETREAALKELLAEKDSIYSKIDNEQNLLGAAEISLDAAKGGLDGLRAQADQLKSDIAKTDALSQRKSDILATIARMESDLQKEKMAASETLKTLRQKYAELDGELKKVNAILADREVIMGAAYREKEIAADIENTQEEIDSLAAEITAGQEKIHAGESAVSDIKQKTKDLSNDSELKRIEKELADLLGRIKEHEQAIEGTQNNRAEIDLAHKIEFAHSKSAGLNLKDPSCQSTTCSFIVGALAAQKELPELERKLEECRASLAETRSGYERALSVLQASKASLDDEWNKRLADIKAETDSLVRTMRDIAGRVDSLKKSVNESVRQRDWLKKGLASRKEELSKAKGLSAKLSEVQLAEFRKSDIEKAMADINTEGREKCDRWGAREIVLKSTIQAERDKADAIVIDFTASDKLKTVQSGIFHLETVEITGIEKDIQASREKIAGHQADLARMVEAELGLRTVQDEKAGIVREIAEWTYIRNACGKTGLQALEIDGAAPLITGYANRLLSMAFGPLFTVRLRTQDDEGREVLDIVVIGEDGDEVLLENLSGGQRVWILKALRLAMTLLSKEKSGRNFESFFSDEEDGALDVDNARNFIALYEAFMKMGGFHAGYFISHKPECRALAENTLVFEAGKNPEWK